MKMDIETINNHTFEITSLTYRSSCGNDYDREIYRVDGKRVSLAKYIAARRSAQAAQCPL
jgi:hypothetical protein